MSTEEEKKPVKKKRKIPKKHGDKYDITVKIDMSFEDAIKKIADDANKKSKRNNNTTS